jgi:predicted ATPase
MVEKRSWLSAFDASEGALYVLFLITLALHPQVPRVLAVDNVDQALNPRLARELVGQVQDLVLADHSRPQMLLTAHNPLVLDSLRLLDDEVRLFVVGRLTNGETTVRRVPWNEAIDQKAKADGLTLSQLWTEGFLGGMPNI